MLCSTKTSNVNRGTPCLHGEPCAHTNTQKVSFWFCNQNPSCKFFCSEDESYLYEKAIAVWKTTKPPHPRCEKHGKLTKMCVVKNLMKANYGRPFFVCSDPLNTCSFWIWGDVRPAAKPQCRHRSPCVIRKFKKETINKDRLFFCCAQEDSCNYFELVPEEPYYNGKFFNPPPIKRVKKNEDLANEFINYLTTILNI